MTDRIVVYPGAIPQDTDILQTNRNLMISLGFLARATMGTGTTVDGLDCHETSPASMNVTIEPGSILINDQVDGTTYGSLPSNTNPLVKIGCNALPTNLALTAPVTAGQSINYLVQGSFLEQDINPVVLPYYNASNPSVPYSGPANSGTAQNTVRSQSVSIQLKAGTPATTGSQATPAADGGWVPLWVITVANAATTVVDANIVKANNAPFLVTKLPQQKIICSSTLHVYVNGSTGSNLNDGLTTKTAFQTIQYAVDYIGYRYDLAKQLAYVHVADGTYTAGAYVFGGNLFGGNQIVFVGNTTTPANCKISLPAGGFCFGADDGAWVTVSGFAVEAPAGSGGALWTVPGVGLQSWRAAVLFFDHVAFGACSYAHMATGQNGSINLAASGTTYSIYGNTLYHMVSGSSGGCVAVPNAVCTIATARAFTIFGIADSSGLLFAPGWAATGAGVAGTTGQRYQATNGGYIAIAGGGASFFPGNVAGTSTTGYYG